jgi:hypothetical protein
MKKLQKFVAAAALIATVGIGGASITNNAQPTEQKAQAVALLTRKVNEYEGQHRKVNEYEGQHRKVNEYEGQHRKVNEYEGQHRGVNEYEGQHRLLGIPLMRRVNEYEGQHR